MVGIGTAVTALLCGLAIYTSYSTAKNSGEGTDGWLNYLKSYALLIAALIGAGVSGLGAIVNGALLTPVINLGIAIIGVIAVGTIVFGDFAREGVKAAKENPEKAMQAAATAATVGKAAAEVSDSMSKQQQQGGGQRQQGGRGQQQTQGLDQYEQRVNEQIEEYNKKPKARYLFEMNCPECGLPWKRVYSRAWTKADKKVEIGMNSLGSSWGKTDVQCIRCNNTQSVRIDHPER